MCSHQAILDKLPISLDFSQYAMHHGSILNSDGSVGKFREVISRDGAIASIMNVLAERFHGLIAIEKEIQTRGDLGNDF